MHFAIVFAYVCVDLLTFISTQMAMTSSRFQAYEQYKSLVCTDVEKPKIAERFLAGSLAGATAQVTIYPLEVIKTRIAVAPEGTYRGLFDCLRSTLAAEGVKGQLRVQCECVGGGGGARVCGAVDGVGGLAAVS